MTRINTNVSSLTAQSNLARSNDQLQTALTRLSTGLRINSGADDPAGLIASEILKADINNTNQAIANSQSADQMVKHRRQCLGPDQLAVERYPRLGHAISQHRQYGCRSDRGQPSRGRFLARGYQSYCSNDRVPRQESARRQPGLCQPRPIGGTATVSNLSIQQANLGSGTMPVTGVITTAATQATVTENIAAAAVATTPVASP